MSVFVIAIFLLNDDVMSQMLSLPSASASSSCGFHQKSLFPQNNHYFDDNPLRHDDAECHYQIVILLKVVNDAAPGR